MWFQIFDCFAYLRTEGTVHVEEKGGLSLIAGQVAEGVCDLVCRVGELFVGVRWMVEVSGCWWVWFVFFEGRWKPKRSGESQVELLKTAEAVQLLISRMSVWMLTYPVLSIAFDSFGGSAGVKKVS